jgi:hypothetical protein
VKSTGSGYSKSSKGQSDSYKPSSKLSKASDVFSDEKYYQGDDEDQNRHDDENLNED